MNNGINKLSFQYNENNKYFLKTNKLKKDSISQLISNFSEVEIFLKEQNIKSKFKNLYLYASNIYDISYEEDKTIFINFEDCSQSLAEYYYLSKLISKKIYFVNFTYSLDFIEKMNNYNKNCNLLLRKVIISKIILISIYNYKGFDEYDNNDEKIKEIEEENRGIIRNSLENFKEIGLNFSSSYIEEIELEDLYIEIVYSLIKKDLIKSNYNYIKKIFTQLDLNIIDISKKFYDKYLKELLSDNKNNEFISKYLILNGSHIDKNKKIFFHYILFNYIIKDTLYIYKIPYLLKIRKIIINEIIRNNNFFPNDLTKKIKGKLIYVIKKLLDCDYYKNLFNDYLIKKEKISSMNE